MLLKLNNKTYLIIYWTSIAFACNFVQTEDEE